jgi:hypothetical protein
MSVHTIALRSRLSLATSRFGATYGTRPPDPNRFKPKPVKLLTFRVPMKRLRPLTTRHHKQFYEMALRRPTVRSRSAPRNHFEIFSVAVEKSVLGTIGERLESFSEVLRRLPPHDASFPPVSTASARFCCAPATASRLA